MGGTSESPITETDDFSSDAVEAFLALPAIYAVTEETSSRVHIRSVREDEELTNWTSVPLYSAIAADVIGTGLDPVQRARMIDFLTEYQEVFAWSYADMPGLDPSIVKHFLPLDTKRFPPKRQHLRRQRADLLLRIKEEVIKQVDARFLEVCNYSEWVANIIPVEKKNGKVRVCIDYRDLNRASPKDNFPLPHIDVLVDNTARLTQFSFMDGFSGYNQIQMAEEDKVKTTFIMMWGIFCYKVMPFGLKNARATYRRHDREEIEVYVDDMIAKSKEGENHLVNLKRLFDRLRKYKLRLNPAKYEGSLQMSGEEEITRWKMYFDGAVNSTESGQFPAFTDRHDRRTLRRIAANFFLSGETLYRRSFDATLLRCVDENEAQRLMEEVHEGNCGPHMNGLMLAKKLMRLGCFWSTMVTDCVKHVRHCHLCQVYANQIRAPPNELHPMAAPWPFSMWGMDVIGPINPKASNGHLFILVAIDYFTKWIEAITLASVTAKTVARFLKRNIIARYGVPATLVTNNAKNLNNKLIDELCAQFKILHCNSSPYRPQMNGVSKIDNHY
ncbi:hypothetical protein CRG98_030041 [Punica granatum]|uniref:Integrase catalytic domain-containing protein n=1 Tax=Punica granatum TaxID=22663 RepID=A0A2I0IZY6_PUNGR|nr:hypothetical protein CRG98_030041 [Punica granatum]